MFYSDRWQVLEERVGSSPQTQYVWGLRYTNDCVLRDTISGSLAGRLYAMQEANWNVVAICDPTEVVHERYSYSPYGVVTIYDPSWTVLAFSAFAWHYLFQGGRLDASKGDYNFQRRDYSPTLGRWTTRDPIAFRSGDVNIYAFVTNNPVRYLDPSGFKIAEVEWCVNNPCCCAAIRSPNVKTMVEDMMKTRYGRDHDNTVENAVKHCALMCYVASRKSCTESQAIALGKAHETGTNHKISKAMDLFNNAVGARLGAATKGQSLTKCFKSCEVQARRYELYWFVAVEGGKPGESLPANFPCFTKIIGATKLDARGKGGCDPPDFSENTEIEE